ncbi:MAG: hypothetical protein M3375_00975 [Actinomycetota bacterium]|nr:hypothetical protein [Actinomycetota bacterium]
MFGLVAIGVLVHSSAGAAPARAEERSAVLARSHAAPWLRLQRPDGSFEDRLRNGRYGESMLGLALLETGLRDGDRRQVNAGLAGLFWAIRRPQLRDQQPSVFEAFALAAAYNLARRRLDGDPLFAALRPDWESWLRGLRPVLLGRRLPFHNHHVVEAAAVLELTASGLSSGEQGTVLAHPAGSRRIAADFFNRVLPAVSRRRRTRVAGRPVALLVDVPGGHLAYQGLTVAFHARAVMLLGAQAKPATRTALLRAARASAALAAPDGDIAFSGRSQEQSWALSLTAYGALRAAAAVRGAERRALAALARRSLRRLALQHPVRDYGVAITPALGRWFAPALAGLDHYADATGFGGLTLLGLSWTAAEPQASAAGAPVRRGIAVLRADRADLAVVRTRRLWWAVRRNGDRRCGLRCDFGLVALKARRPGGFEDVLRLRPRALGTAGPVLLRGRRQLKPVGVRMGRRGRSLIVGTRFGRRYARFRFAPGRCGPVMSWPARRGDRFEYSVYLPPGSQLRRRRRGLETGGLLLRSRSRLRARMTGDLLASGADPQLTRALLTVRARRSGPLRIEHCPR